jgi:cytochrome P450
MPTETPAATWLSANGVHQCIGANLARIEVQVAFATLARGLPGLQLAVSPDGLKFKDADIYGMKELPVTW